METIKKVLLLVLLLVLSIVSGSILAQSPITFTNQADFDNYSFNPHTRYHVILDNDTTLPEGQQINSLAPISVVDSTLTIELINTWRVKNLNAIKAKILELYVEGRQSMDTVMAPPETNFISQYVVYNTTGINYIGGSENAEKLGLMYFYNNETLKKIELNFPNAEPQPQVSVELIVHLNDSLEEFWWMNDKHVLRQMYIEENRQLRHLHVESINEAYYGGYIYITFNPELDSISGMPGRDKLANLTLKKNYSLSNACVFQKGVQKGLDGGILPSVYVIEENAQGLRSLQDLLDADCSYLYVGVAETPGEGELPGIYPNPAVEEVYVTEYRAGEEYRLYDMSGRMVQRGLPEPGGRIGIIRLQPGFYVLEYGGQRIKMIKE